MGQGDVCGPLCHVHVTAISTALTKQGIRGSHYRYGACSGIVEACASALKDEPALMCWASAFGSALHMELVGNNPSRKAVDVIGGTAPVTNVASPIMSTFV